MTIVIVSTSILIMFVGVTFAIWTLVDTRKRYYNDFLKRKSEREKLHLP